MGSCFHRSRCSRLVILDKNDYNPKAYCITMGLSQKPLFHWSKRSISEVHTKATPTLIHNGPLHLLSIYQKLKILKWNQNELPILNHCVSFMNNESPTTKTFTWDEWKALWIGNVKGVLRLAICPTVLTRIGVGKSHVALLTFITAT